MTKQQRETIRQYAIRLKHGNINSYKIALKLSKLPAMSHLLIKDIENEILNICPNFNFI